MELDLSGVDGRSSRVVRLESAAPVNNLQVIHFGRSDELSSVRLKLKPWDVLWVEVE